MGGSKAWISLLPYVPTDISISVDAAVKEEAEKTGCKVISLYNDTPERFLYKLSELKKFKAKTTFHLALTDHGASSDRNINKTRLITGTAENDFVSYEDFFKTLKENIPQGSHVTFSTNNCYASVSEGLLANNLDEHFDICGGSSTVPTQLSWNLHKTEHMNNSTVGPYGAVGLRFANQHLKASGQAPSLAQFHYHAKMGDLGNLGRQPGLTTSIVYAQQIAAKLNRSALFKQDITDVLTNINWKKNNALDTFLSMDKKELNHNTELYLSGVCTKFSTSPFDEYIKLIAPLHASLVNTNYDELPEPYKTQSLDALGFMQNNQKKLAAVLVDIATDKARFIKRRQNYPAEDYTIVEQAWKKLEQKNLLKLKDYQFHLRNLQEGKTIKEFLNIATTAEKKRFQRLVECERKPLF